MKMYAKVMTIAIQKCLKNNEILKYNHREKSIKIPFVINTDLESLLEKNTCYNNFKALSSTKIKNQTASGYSLFAHSLFVQLIQ